MTVTVEYDSYSELCGNTFYGKHFLDLTSSIIDALDSYFDGQTFSWWRSGAHPDNMWVNSCCFLDEEEVLVHQTRLLTYEEYHELLEKGQLEDYINKYRAIIEDRLLGDFYVLGYDDGWHVLS